MSLERRVLPDGTSVFVEVPRKPAFALAHRPKFKFKQAAIAEGIGEFLSLLFSKQSAQMHKCTNAKSTNAQHVHTWLRGKLWESVIVLFVDFGQKKQSSLSFFALF